MQCALMIRPLGGGRGNLVRLLPRPWSGSGSRSLPGSLRLPLASGAGRTLGWAATLWTFPFRPLSSGRGTLGFLWRTSLLHCHAFQMGLHHELGLGDPLFWPWEWGGVLLTAGRGPTAHSVYILQ